MVVPPDIAIAKNLKPVEKLLLTYIHSRGKRNYTNEELALFTGASARTIQRLLPDLHERYLIEITGETTDRTIEPLPTHDKLSLATEKLHLIYGGDKMAIADVPNSPTHDKMAIAENEVHNIYEGDKMAIADVPTHDNLSSYARARPIPSFPYLPTMGENETHDKMAIADKFIVPTNSQKNSDWEKFRAKFSADEAAAIDLHYYWNRIHAWAAKQGKANINNPHDLARKFMLGDQRQNSLKTNNSNHGSSTTSTNKKSIISSDAQKRVAARFAQKYSG